MRVSIFGSGYVGLVTGASLADSGDRGGRSQGDRAGGWELLLRPHVDEMAVIWHAGRSDVAAL